MKILLVHNFYQQRGGEQFAVEAQQSLLRAYGHEVVMFSRHSKEVARYNSPEKARFICRTLYSVEMYDAMRDVLQTEKPDLVHVHNVFPLLSPSIYRSIADHGAPLVQTVHNFRFLCPNALFYVKRQICERCKYGNTLHAIPRRCYRNSYLLSGLYALTVGIHRRLGSFSKIDRFIAPTEFSAKQLVESGLAPASKIRVLGHFLPEPLPAPGSFTSRERNVMYLGRLSAEKGVATLLEAMEGFSHVRLRIAGDGPLANDLRSLAARKRLRQVEFLGHRQDAEKWNLLKTALVTVSPSLCYETFGLSALESMAAGTPVVASDIGSLPYVVQDGKSGLLYRASDFSDLRAKLSRLLDEPQIALRMGQFARREVENKFTARAHYDKLMPIYNEVCE